MRRILSVLSILLSLHGYGQLKDYSIGVKGDTLNAVDRQDRKQGKWTNHVDEVRGEPGFEEEGVYKDNRKEGPWRIYNLNGDLTGIEYYRWGNKDGICQYFTPGGELLREEGWKALNPDKQYDTLVVEDIDKLDSYHTVIVKNEGVGLKHGDWKYYNTVTGMVIRTESYTLGKLESKKAAPQPTAGGGDKKPTKPKEVLDFEKKAGKKKVRVQDGSAF